MRIEILHTLYWKIYNQYWTFLAKCFPTAATRKKYKKVLGCYPNLKNPKTLNEKLQWLKLNTYYRNPFVCQCSDKYAVREFVKSKGCDEILNKLYAVYDDPRQINWGGAG